jgi:hypothetical protein
MLSHTLSATAQRNIRNGPTKMTRLIMRQAPIQMIVSSMSESGGLTFTAGATPTGAFVSGLIMFLRLECACVAVVRLRKVSTILCHTRALDAIRQNYGA